MNHLKLTCFSTRTMHSIIFLLICLSLFGCGNGNKKPMVSSENELSDPAPKQNDQATPVPEKIDETLLNHHATQNSSITKNNVGSMAMSWKYATPYPVSHAPLVDNTGVYFGDWGGTVYKYIK
ncbi:MAG: PQQ-binding-like beta-propeller repeat protein [Segetibacter sp.]